MPNTASDEVVHAAIIDSSDRGLNKNFPVELPKLLDSGAR